jgi:hypothetical protein
MYLNINSSVTSECTLLAAKLTNMRIDIKTEDDK